MAPDERDSPTGDHLATDVEVQPRAHVLRGSSWAVASLALNGLSGLAFWWVAAVRYPQAEIGHGSELFAITLFVVYATSMGLPIAVARFAHDQTHRSRALFSMALAYTTLTSAAGAIGFLLIAPDGAAAPLWSLGRPAGTLVMFASVTGISYAALVETRLLTLRLWGWVLARVALVALVRFPLLFIEPLGHDDQALWLFLLVAGAPALSGIVGAAALRGRVPLRTVSSHRQEVLRYATVNYVGMLALQAPQFTVPILVGASVDATEFASFFLAWQVTMVTLLVPHMIGQIVLAEASKDRFRSSWYLRVGLRTGLAFMAVALGGTLVARGAITAVLSRDYQLVADLLVPLLLAGLPWTVTTMTLVRARLLRDSGVVLMTTLLFAASVLVPAAVLTRVHGVGGTMVAWLCGHVVSAATGTAFVLVPRRHLARADRSPAPAADQPA